MTLLLDLDFSGFFEKSKRKKLLPVPCLLSLLVYHQSWNIITDFRIPWGTAINSKIRNKPTRVAFEIEQMCIVLDVKSYGHRHAVRFGRSFQGTQGKRRLYLPHPSCPCPVKNQMSVYSVS